MASSLRRLIPLVPAFIVVAAIALAAQRQSAPPPAPGLPLPIDPQQVQDPDDMTWADYHPIPGVDWASPTLTPGRTLTLALVAIDFDDQPFVITKPKGSDPFGNPQIDPIARDKVPSFYADFITKPNALNHGQTINRYWMEISRGKVGVPKVDAFGPYRMPKKLFEYGLNEYNQNGSCPTGFNCNNTSMERDGQVLWSASAGADIRTKYDRVLWLYAGYDETSVWQEFGEMKFNTKEDIPAEWGNPDTTKPRWVPTRYVEWTSWLAGAQQWGLSSIRQGESSGTITHEMGHAVMNIGDNNNNPYVKPYHRVGTGTWDMMDRGGFNGPKGPHSRWVVPVQAGGSMPAGFILRNKIWAGFLTKEQVLNVDRDSLAASGPAVATVVARAVEPGPGQFAGVVVRLDGDIWTRPQRGGGGGGGGGGGAAAQTYADKSPMSDPNTDPLCSLPQFNNYSMEVVQRIGYDSFTTDNGVLIVKNKDQQGPACGYSCHAWVIDAHPEDMNMIDFVKPNGTKVMRTIADYRQLDDALFHAGLRSGSQFEWEDAANRLHFYIIDRQMSAAGVLSYVVGVKSLDGAGPQTRGVAATAPANATLSGQRGTFQVAVANSGKPASAGSTQGSAAAFKNDIYRIRVTVDGAGWSGDVANALVAVPFGASANVPVSFGKTGGAAATATVTVTVTSESDPTKVATVKVTVK